MRFEVDNSLSLANTKVSVHSQVTFKTSQEKKRGRTRNTSTIIGQFVELTYTTYPLQELRDRPIMTLQIRYMGCGHVSHTYIIIT